MSASFNYQDLSVWQKAIQIAKATYVASASLPTDERYGLSTQMKRASVSIAANLAEGHSRDSTKDFLRFINIAQGSLSETETHLILAKELGLLGDAAVKPILLQCAELGKLLNGLKRSLHLKIAGPSPLHSDLSEAS